MKKRVIALITVIALQLSACAYRIFALYYNDLRHPHLSSTFSWQAEALHTFLLTAALVLLTLMIYFLLTRIFRKRTRSLRKESDP